MVNKAVRARRVQANYLNIGTTGTEKYVFMGVGFTELNESPSAQTKSKRYINDKGETKSVVGYDWSTAFTTDQIRADEAVEFICNIGEMQLIGSDAETDYIIVDLDKKVGIEPNEFRARKFKVAIEISEFGNEDGEMTASGNLLGVGDMTIGKFNTETKKFIEGESL